MGTGNVSQQKKSVRKPGHGCSRGNIQLSQGRRSAGGIACQCVASTKIPLSCLIAEHHDGASWRNFTNAGQSTSEQSRRTTAIHNVPHDFKRAWMLLRWGWSMFASPFCTSEQCANMGVIGSSMVCTHLTDDGKRQQVQACRAHKDSFFTLQGNRTMALRRSLDCSRERVCLLFSIPRIPSCGFTNL